MKNLHTRTRKKAFLSLLVAASCVVTENSIAQQMGISFPQGMAPIITNGLQMANGLQVATFKAPSDPPDPLADTDDQNNQVMPTSLLVKPDTATVAHKAPAPATSVVDLFRAEGFAIAGVDPALSALIARCAPTVHPETMAAVISAESRGHQFAIADAGPVHLPWSQRKSMVRSLYPSSVEEAVATAQNLISRGHTVSLGIAQVNDRNLASMGVTVKDMFDPCTNVAVGGKILTDFYERAVKKFGVGPGTLDAALSAYNSGDWTRGARDGYVNLIYKQVGKPLTLKSQRVVPKLSGTPTTNTVAVTSSATSMSAASYTPAATAKQTPRAARIPSGQREFTMNASNFSATEMR